MALGELAFAFFGGGGLSGALASTGVGGPAAAAVATASVAAAAHAAGVIGVVVKKEWHDHLIWNVATGNTPGGEDGDDYARRLEELSKNPQTGKQDSKSREEAISILQAESEGIVQGARRPNLDYEPDLDFVIEGGYADVKTPQPPLHQPIPDQAANIARSINTYEPGVTVIVDLKKLSGADKISFIGKLKSLANNLSNVHFLNQ